MKLKKVLSICKANGLYYLYDRIDRSGEITQWLGDGYAIYPLDGLPILDEESFCAVFDITGKQREKILFRHERLPEHLNVEDVAAGDKLVREYETTFINGGLRLKPLKTNNGVTWIMEDRYNPDGAEKRYRENLAAKGAPLKIGNDHELADYLERKVIEEDRSPAAALADITIEGRTFKTSICVSTFYGYIEKGVFLNLTNKDLPEKPKRKRPYHKVKTTKRAPRGESIEKRPEVINQRITFGHWEMDTVYSGKDGSCALLVLTERLSRKEIIEKMRDRTAISTVRALNRIERRFGALFPRVFQTITVDNGGEFSDVKSLERSILRKGRRTKMYYCHPYTSCERGSNECANKMIRRKFPKGTDFNKVSRAEVKKAEEWMNNYPREILGWKTAEIVFAECLEELAREA